MKAIRTNLRIWVSEGKTDPTHRGGVSFLSLIQNFFVSLDAELPSFGHGKPKASLSSVHWKCGYGSN
jgi:hypothetical protein